jgi:hypothetical protein
MHQSLTSILPTLALAASIAACGPRAEAPAGSSMLSAPSELASFPAPAFLENLIVSTLTDDPRIRGNTAVALRGAGAERAVIVLGTGGLSEGGKDPGVVLSVPLPE